MLVRDTVWERIREKFSEGGKVKLRAAITGHTICPTGFAIDPLRIDVDLEFRLTNALTEDRIARTGK